MKKMVSVLGECCSSLLRHSPIGAEIFVDTAGDWQVADMELIWHNERAGVIFGQPDMVGRRPYATTPKQYNQLQSILDKLRESAYKPTSAKPMLYQIEQPNGEDLVLEVSMVALEAGKLLVWMVDRTGHAFKDRMIEAGQSMRQTPWMRLSLRERAVATLIVRQKTTTEIAEILGVSQRTVDNHRLSIRKKFNMVGEGVDLYEYLMNHN